MLELEPGMIVWTWITFILVLVLLSKLALKPILNAVDKREQSIRDDLKAAQQQRDEAQALLDQHKKMMADAESEARKLFQDSKSLAEKARQELLDKAQQESKQVLEKAKLEIEQQKNSALASLKAEVADLAVGAAEKILLVNLDADRQRAVVDEYLKTMPKSAKN